MTALCKLGQIEFTASGERIVGEIKVVSHESSYDRTETRVVKSTWLSRECGGVKAEMRTPAGK